MVERLLGLRARYLHGLELGKWTMSITLTGPLFRRRSPDPHPPPIPGLVLSQLSTHSTGMVERVERGWGRRRTRSTCSTRGRGGQSEDLSRSGTSVGDCTGVGYTETRVGHSGRTPTRPTIPRELPSPPWRGTRRPVTEDLPRVVLRMSRKEERKTKDYSTDY